MKNKVMYGTVKISETEKGSREWNLRILFPDGEGGGQISDKSVEEMLMIVPNVLFMEDGIETYGTERFADTFIFFVKKESNPGFILPNHLMHLR